MENPYIRILIAQWIQHLDSVPDIEMLDFLPEFLEGLFNMLPDENREIRTCADSLLAEFMAEIKNLKRAEFPKMVPILIRQSRSDHKWNRLHAVKWLHDFVVLAQVDGQLRQASKHVLADSDPPVCLR